MQEAVSCVQGTLIILHTEEMNRVSEKADIVPRKEKRRKTGKTESASATAR